MAGSAATREKRTLKAKDREALRAIIETENLITKVQRFALASLIRVDGELTLPDSIRMTSEQIGAAMKLLAKVLPDLASVEIGPDPDAVVVLPEPMSPEAWAAAHGADGTETVQ
jgi:hypothetical protein